MNLQDDSNSKMFNQPVKSIEKWLPNETIEIENPNDSNCQSENNDYLFSGNDDIHSILAKKKMKLILYNRRWLLN